MSVRGRIPARAPFALRFAILQLAIVLLVVAGCTDGIFSPTSTGRGQLQLRPVFSSVNWQSISADINVVRVTVMQLPARSIVLREETAVDPAAPEWQLPTDVPINTDLEILVELINRTGSVDVVVYSGRMLVNVKIGQPLATNITVYPGPPENLDITSLTLSPKNRSLLEGDQFQLTANVVGTANPTILWTSSNPSVATVDANGVVTAAGLGQATIQAIAGPQSDNMAIDVGARVAAIQLTPTAPTLASIGDEVVFTSQVVDAHNAQINLPVVYQISDPTVATEVSPGRFRAKKTGQATVTASVVQGGQTISASTTLTVQQAAATLSVNPPSRNFDALGDVSTFTAEARDALGNVLPNGALNWTSSDPAVATVDFGGAVSTVGNGTAKIRVQRGALSAESQITVHQVAVSVSLTPGNVVLNVGEAIQMAGSVLDARGNTMAVPLDWSVELDPSAASVSIDGLVTARKRGQAVIQARFGNLTATSNITVNQPNLVQLQFDKPQVALVVYGSMQVNATFAYSNGVPTTGSSIVYTVANPLIATVSQTGVVTGLVAGQTEVIATAGALQARIPVTVAPPPVTQIILDRSQVQLLEGQSVQVSAFLADALGLPAAGDPIVFSSANTAIALVNSLGVVTAVSSGTTEIIATSQGLQRRLPVTVTFVPKGDVIVFSDLNVFDESPDSPSNRLMLKNLVTFGSSAPRASGNWVWLDRVDPTNCAFCGKTFEFMRKEIGKAGLTTEGFNGGNGRLTNIPNSVKAMFLFVSGNTYTPSEVGLLKSFVAEGGRLVLLGGHDGAAAEQLYLNDLLLALGSDLRAGNTKLSCGRAPVPSSSLRTHQVTTGMTDYRAGCSLAFSLGAGDEALIYDETNTIPIVAATRLTGGQN